MKNKLLNSIIQILIVLVCQLIIYILNAIQIDFYNYLIQKYPEIIGYKLDVVISCIVIIIPIVILSLTFNTSAKYWILSIIILRVLMQLFPKYGRYLWVEVNQNVGSGIPFGSSYETITKIIASFVIMIVEVVIVVLINMIKNKCNSD